MMAGFCALNIVTAMRFAHPRQIRYEISKFRPIYIFNTLNNYGVDVACWYVLLMAKVD